MRCDTAVVGEWTAEVRQEWRNIDGMRGGRTIEGDLVGAAAVNEAD